MVLSWYLLLQRPAEEEEEEEEEECLRSFLMCFLCLRSDGIVVVVSYLRKRQWTSSFQDEVVALCVCVCVCVCVCFHLTMTHAYGMFRDILQKGNRHMMRSMMRACLSFSTNLSPSGSG
jgi:hypothetical protein